jgi:NTE family protein
MTVMLKVGLVLGGGGVAGSAHLGVMQALEEAGIAIHCVAGTSSGALTAALYAYGYSTQELIEMVPTITKDILDYDIWALVKKIINRKSKFQGFVKGKKMLNFLVDQTRGAMMEGIQFPVALLAADQISHIRIADAIMASCSIPILFRPVHFENRMLVDGGLMDNCPVAFAHLLGADKVIAVDLVSAPTKTSLPSLRSILARVVTVNLVSQARQRLSQADVILRPDVGAVAALDFTQTHRCIECGYEYTKRRMDTILRGLTEPELEPELLLHNIPPAQVFPAINMEQRRGY